MVRPTRPIMPSGIPGFSEMSLPRVAAVERTVDAAVGASRLGAPMPCVRTPTMAAKRWSGFDGFITRSMAPAWGLTKSTFSQVSPPSRVRKTPFSSFGPKAVPQRGGHRPHPGCQDGSSHGRCGVNPKGRYVPRSRRRRPFCKFRRRRRRSVASAVRQDQRTLMSGFFSWMAMAPTAA